LQRIRPLKFSRHFFDDVIGNSSRVAACSVAAFGFLDVDVDEELAKSGAVLPRQLEVLVPHAEKVWQGRCYNFVNIISQKMGQNIVENLSIQLFMHKK
jgi:hypothetical protein